MRVIADPQFRTIPDDDMRTRIISENFSLLSQQITALQRENGLSRAEISKLTQQVSFDGNFPEKASAVSYAVR